MSFESLLAPVRDIAREAGQAIMEVYVREDHEVVKKDDKSPLTAADLAAHACIARGLAALDPAIPLLSEEGASVPWEERRHWERYWLVDPLDGTREFIKRNGEFTVNIALIERDQPVLGVVYAPVLNWMYSGASGIGATKEADGKTSSIHTRMVEEGGAPLRVVASRSHRSELLDAWFAAMEARWPEIEVIGMGSSLKLCLVAEGQADIYPRLGPTSEWDTAAAQAVLEAAGGAVLGPSGERLRYNHKESLLNPHFYAQGNPGLRFITA